MTVPPSHTVHACEGIKPSEKVYGKKICLTLTSFSQMHLVTEAPILFLVWHPHFSPTSMLWEVFLLRFLFYNVVTKSLRPHSQLVTQRRPEPPCSASDPEGCLFTCIALMDRDATSFFLRLCSVESPPSWNVNEYWTRDTFWSHKHKTHRTKERWLWSF